MSTYTNRADAAYRARDHFVKAAAAITEHGAQTEALAFALLEGATALMRIAEADPERKACERVRATIAAVNRAEEVT